MYHVVFWLLLVPSVVEATGRSLRSRIIADKLMNIRLTDEDLINTSENQSQFDCVLTPTDASKTFFKHNVYYNDLNFVYLNIQLVGDAKLRRLSKYVIEENLWTWTFYGKDGAFEFLNWPREFGIWSMGLLNTYIEELPVTLKRESGNCSNLTVGDKKVNQAISEGLIQLVIGLINISMVESERYGPSFFCYRERMFIQPQSLYVFCKHIVCPIEAMKYTCCSYVFIREEGRREIVCSRKNSNDTMAFAYDDLWWTGPTIVSIMIFAYFPLSMLNLACRLTAFSKITTTYTIVGHNNEESYVFYDGNPQITLLKSLFAPLMTIYSRIQTTSSRFLRVFLPFLSISFIGFQIYIDNKYLKTFVLDSINKGTPMGFRSMLAGYEGSQCIFLPYLGGPYVALGLYIVIAVVFVCLPRSLSGHLESGIPDSRSDEPCSPLVLSLQWKEKFGSTAIRGKTGFKKVYNTCLAQFYMLINKDYWISALEIQTRRFVSCRHGVCLAVFPFYIILCVFEHLLCIILYGFPVIFFTQVLFRSYYRRILRMQAFRPINACSIIGIALMMTFLVLSLSILLFMFFTIFLDACLFLTRMFIFTFTGLVIFPKNSYGYFIFVLTAVYYLAECIQNFSQTYTRILRVTIKVCKRMQRANDSDPFVVKKGPFPGVQKEILDHVIAQLKPIHKEVFSSLLRLSLVLGAIGVTLLLLDKTDKFQELHVLVHVSTALFTCALPKLTRMILGKRDDDFVVKQLEEKVESAIRRQVYERIDMSEEESDVEFE